MSTGRLVILSALSSLYLWYAWRWYGLETAQRTDPVIGPRLPRSGDLVIGFVTNFFDTLGIGSFAPTTAIFKLQQRVPDEQIPGTLNAGHAPPTLVEGLIFIAAVTVAIAGAWLGAGVVSRLSRRAVQVGMGIALIVAAALFCAANLRWMPGGGDAMSLSGGRFALAVSVNFLLGSLMTLGIGLYAPCLMLVSLLGMNPLAAFPIMMGSCAFLMPVGGVRFISKGRYSLPAALGLTVGGIPGVLIAAFIVKTLPVVWLRWLVVVVVIYAAVMMLRSARSTAPQPGMTPT